MSNIIERVIAARHHDAGFEWACFRELSTGTGHSGHAGRTADLFALNCWPSKGFRAVAYEAKVSRSDFKREIEDMTKRAPWEKLAHECYFATPPGLVKPDEVPEGWGLVEVGAEVRVVKVATQRTPEPWPVAFCASIARRSADPSLRKMSRAVWKFMGKDLTADDLDALVKERYGESRQLALQASAAPVATDSDRELAESVRFAFPGKSDADIKNLVYTRRYSATRLRQAITLLEGIAGEKD